MSDKSKAKKIFDFSLLKRVFRYAAPYKNKFYTSLGLAILLAVIAPIRPYLIQVTINSHVSHGASTQDVKQQLSSIDVVILITIIQIGLLLVETAFRFYFTFLTSWLGQTVVKDLRVRVYKKILGLNLRQFDTTPIGTLTTRTINDIEAINDIFSDGLIPIVADLLSIFAVLTVMFVSDWRLTLVSMAPFPFLIVATYFFKESVNKSFIRVRNAVAALNAFVQEHITGMQVVQAFAAEGREYKKFKNINMQYRNANIRSIFAYSVFFPIVEITLAVSTGLLVWWLAGLAADNPIANKNLAGELVAFVLYLNQIFRPLRVIADKFNTIQMGMVSAERILRVMDNDDYIKKEGDYAPAHIKGSIVFH